MAEEPVSRHGKGFSAYRNSRFLMTGQANQLTVSMLGKPLKKLRIYSRKTVRAQILPYFRITMNIYSHSAQRFCIFMRFVFRSP